MDVELKPCPFCGSSDVHIVAGDKCDEWGTCVNCGADGPFRDTEAQAIAAWNRRDGKGGSDGRA
jgi:Lar family restriction alleviation protein